MMSIDIDNIAILNIIGIDYCCIVFRISLSEAINLLKNANLSRKVDLCKMNKKMNKKTLIINKTKKS